MNTTEIKNLVGWIEKASRRIPFGEIGLLIKIHDGKPALVEKSIIEKIQVSGYTGGPHANTNR